MTRQQEHEDPTDPELAAQLQSMVARSRRVLWIVVLTQGITLALACLAIIMLTLGAAQARHRIAGDEATVRAAECDQHFTIATLAIPDHTTKVLVSFVESSRKAFVVLHCPGNIGRPQANLIRFGRRFGVPVRY